MNKLKKLNTQSQANSKFEHGFFRTSDVFYDNTFYSDLSNDAILLYSKLYRMAGTKEAKIDKNGNLYISFENGNEDIADLIRCKTRKVSSLLKALEEHGLIEREKRGHTRIYIYDIDSIGEEQTDAEQEAQFADSSANNAEQSANNAEQSANNASSICTHNSNIINYQREGDKETKFQKPKQQFRQFDHGERKYPTDLERELLAN